MQVGILGAAAFWRDGAPVDVGTRKQRALLAALTLHRGRAVSTDVLVDLLWGEAPPAAVSTTLQGYVAGLRRALEPDRAPRAPARVLLTAEDGYLLDVPATVVDAECFAGAVAEVHERLDGEGPLEAAGLNDLQARLDGALALWRGSPYTELENSPAAVAERARLEELRAVALEDRAVVALRLGRHQVVAAELEVLTATYPLRERLWALRALALARSGRQADALEVLRQVRELLTEELGLEPGGELRDLQAAVLKQDPSLEWSAPPGHGRTAADARPSPAPDAPAQAPPARSAPAKWAGAEWPLVGRDDELAALVGLLEQSVEGPVFAVVTGEPGIGKSRLCAELAATARDIGTTVLVGRCSQDEGAPPLYPWASVLRDLGHDLPSSAEETERGADFRDRFRAWEAITRTVLDAARERPLLVILDDLHWADTSTLRVLRLIAETAVEGRLMVLATWRHQPPPTGHLAEAAEMLARRHALRLQLSGLNAAEAGEILGAVATTTPTTSEAGALRDRTDGNPFFLVEYARLARERGDLGQLLTEPDPPAAVQDVLTRRIATLPDPAAAALRWAAVLGRYFDVPTLAVLLEADEEEVLDRLDVALRAGLVREFGVDRFRFAHALVRDTVYAGLSQSRRGRMHARAATALADVRGRESEVARHWLAAGPQHAAQGWRAAGRAAEAATAVFAYDEAVELWRAAHQAALLDPAVTAVERHELLVAEAAALQLAGNWIEMRTTVREAIAVATELDDVERVLQATTLLTTNALWQSGHYGEDDVEVVAALRAALERLPEADSPLRCRAMVSLAHEVYYSAKIQERDALCDEALAMARRLGDERLLLWTLLSIVLPLWRPSSAGRRIDIAEEAAALARRLGDDVAYSTALTQLSSALAERGRVAEVPAVVAAAREASEAVRHHFAIVVLDGLELPWCAMRGDFARADVLLANMVALHDRLSLSQGADSVLGAVLMRQLWSGDLDGLLNSLPELDDVTVLPPEAPVAAMLCRAGRVEEARKLLSQRSLDLSPHWWYSSLITAMAAEAAAHVGRPDIAAEAYAVLAEIPDQSATGGSGTAVGPVQAFLALAAYATGERELATRHADEAVRLCAEWEIPLAAEWFAGVRRTFGF